MKNNTSRSSGQILVIFAVALVALLAFVALAIDGGMIFVDRRYNQGVADASSLAGAGAAAQYLDDHSITYTNFSCNNATVLNSFGVAIAAAEHRAATNQVTTLDTDLSDKNGVEVLCVNNPTTFQRYIDVHTMVTSTVATSLIQIVYPYPIKNTVNAVVRIHPRTEFEYGRAIVSLSDTCGSNNGGVVFDGTSDVFVTGGGVFSNSCITASGNVRVGINSGGINYVTDLTTNGGPTLSPTPAQSSGKLPPMDLGPVSCGTGAASSVNGGGTISPGNYSTIKLTNNQTLILNPGLYCVSGGLDLQGGEIDGDGVTIYLTNSAGMSVNGGVTVHLNAPTDANVTAGSIVGILIYMAEGNTANINLQGNSGSSFTGAVYAPNGSIDIGGTTGVNPTYNTQLVGNFVKVHGTSRIDINFNTFPQHMVEPKLDVNE